jgi:hypothetical protein
LSVDEAAGEFQERFVNVGPALPSDTNIEDLGDDEPLRPGQHRDVLRGGARAAGPLIFDGSSDRLVDMVRSSLR